MALQIKKLLVRAQTAAIGFAVIGGMILYLPKWCFLLFLALVGCAGIYEARRLVENFGGKLFLIPAALTVWLGIGSVYFPSFPLIYLLFSVFGFTVLQAMKPPAAMATTMPNSGLTLTVCAYLGCALIALAQLFALDNALVSGMDAGRVLVGFCILMVWAGDSSAYLIGSMFGKHKISPNVSPNKSWEGFIANLVGNFAFALLCSKTLLTELDLRGVFILTVLFGLLGFLGDLAESSWKRGSAIKDSGSLLPGHGGLLDRLDSFFLTAPIFYVYMTRFVL